jgi:serine-type D-Ala-D-Ala carboxypeptidase
MIMLSWERRADHLDEIAREIVGTGLAPAAAVGVAYRDPSGWKFSVGAAGTLWPAASATVTPESLFDLASLTKPLVAMGAAMSLAKGELVASEQLHHMLPGLTGTPAGQATLEQLLSHRAGLVAHLPLYDVLRQRAPIDTNTLLRMAAEAAWSPTGDVDDARGTPLYSDLGYILVGAALANRWGESLESRLERTLFHPLELLVGSVHRLLAMDPGLFDRMVPTENVAWRGGLLRGVVHDENAWALSGYGLSGHAGAFGTVGAVLRFGAAILDGLNERSHVVDQEAARFMTRERPFGSLRAGVDGRSAKRSNAGTIASREVFGHLGFTGTSFYCDPPSQVVVSVLTNRVCPARNPNTFSPRRPILHDRLFLWGREQCQTRLH